LTTNTVTRTSKIGGYTSPYLTKNFVLEI